MEEAASWKNHSFTLAIFGGIIVLCSIFFALGMVVGRTQGRHIAEVAYAEKVEKDKTSDEARDSFPLNFFDETTNDKPDLTLQPPQPAPDRAEPAPKAAPSKASKPASIPPKVAATGQLFLQVYSSRDRKQAEQELKRVRGKKFKANIVPKTVNNVKVHTILVGPYKESEINLARKDVQAKGYKDAFIAK